MYSFSDRGGESLTLRPEGTAGIARSFLSNGWTRQTPLRFFYNGPMFRYERPQKGRQRQFQQFGVEFLGAPSPYADLDVISLADLTLKNLGLSGQVTLEVNSLGDLESRNNYRRQLIEYLKPLKNNLSEDSQRRLAENPLRILDSKDEVDQQVIQNAPNFEDSLTESSSQVYQQILEGLENLGIPYTKNSQLVRGLDYYSDVVFEFKAPEGLGSQNTVLAGGRYNGLIEMMGGPETHAVGFAAGIERLALLTSPPNVKNKTFAGVALSENYRPQLQQALAEIRKKGFTAIQFYSGNSAKQMKKANNQGADYAILVGETEVNTQSVSIKNLSTGEQENIPTQTLDAWLEKLPTP